MTHDPVQDVVPATERIVRMFDALSPQPPDSLLALIGRHRADPRPHKIDLGVGVYRDDAGDTPVLQAVKAAEAMLLATQDTKSYLGAEGDRRFLDLLAPIVFGAAVPASDPLVGVQTPGGTGALRLGIELVARAAPDARVWVSTPTWPNHAPIAIEAGLGVAFYPFLDPATSDLDADSMMSALAGARPGDVVLLHGCCHNPTGITLSDEHWRSIRDLIAERGLVPFVDLAYQGMGDGLDRDAAGLRSLLDCPEILVAYSCDKNFGLYRERVGALWIKTSSPQAAGAVRDTMLALARSLWSMPPDHGAAVVRLILDTAELDHLWRRELDAMRLRLGDIRTALSGAHPALAPIGRQRGLFAMLPIDRATVVGLRERHGIYMAESARINLAGLNRTTLPAFLDALLPVLPARASAGDPAARHHAA